MFRCSVCNYSANSVRAYGCHLRLHRNVANLRFKCCISNCINTFSTSAALSTHVNRYHTSLECSRTIDTTSLRCSINFCIAICCGTAGLIKHLKVQAYHVHILAAISTFQRHQVLLHNQLWHSFTVTVK